MTFGEKLQKLRAREGISQDALAELLNVSRQAVSKWERDETMPEAEKIIRISDCFHVTTDYLLKDIPEEDRDIPHRREFGEWFRDRGWLLGWIPLLWGLWRMARMWTFAAYGDSLWMRLWMWLIYAMPYGNIALTGIAAVLLGRRLAGRLRWYHAGGLPVFWSVLELARAALLALMERKRPSSVFLAEEGLWNRYQGWLLLATLAAAVGLTVLMLGKWADTKREI